ncbi:MAG: indole-3-glycerol phosphate synthase TrpC, partial [Prevotella sp.]|nr:indole-3-glycerol phosphate synthase TrpC [Prevotella sp.]
MKDILNEITAHKRTEVECFKKILTEKDIHRQVEDMMLRETVSTVSMSKAIMEGSGIIAEFKRRSPSKGWIKEDGRPDIVPLDYQQHGASAISILTDSRFFGGQDMDITTARHSGVVIPILYKNFVIDEYQLFQARLCGASAVLLIAACLSKEHYRSLLATAHALHMEVLLEMHAEAELEYAEDMPDMCGINNRNLGTFVTDVQNSFSMADKLPHDTVKVSESGISSPETVRALKAAG